MAAMQRPFIVYSIPMRQTDCRLGRVITLCASRVRQGLDGGEARSNRVFYLPSYGQQLHSETWVKTDLMSEYGKRSAVRTRARLREVANQHMAMLGRTTEWLMGTSNNS